MSCVFQIELHAEHNIRTEAELEAFFDGHNMPVPEWDMESIQKSLAQSDDCWAVMWDCEMDAFVIYHLEAV